MLMPTLAVLPLVLVLLKSVVLALLTWCAASPNCMLMSSLIAC